jgi:acetolactate synthase-1/2/3 large subunit
MTRNGGDVVVETLSALGVSHVFGIPGQHALGLFDAIRRSDLTFVSSRIENNSAFGADGYTRATGEVGVLFLSTGPVAHRTWRATGSVRDGRAAARHHQPGARSGLGLRRGMLHQLDDQQRSAVNVTKSTAVVRRAAEIPSLLADAWALAQSAPAGPTWVEIPQDVLLEPTDGAAKRREVVTCPGRIGGCACHRAATQSRTHRRGCGAARLRVAGR